MSVCTSVLRAFWSDGGSEGSAIPRGGEAVGAYAGSARGGRLLSSVLMDRGSGGGGGGEERKGAGGFGAAGAEALRGGDAGVGAQEAWLCSLPALNPLSAAALLSTGCSLRRIVEAVCQVRGDVSW